jgi:hypothetical protein
MRPIYDHANAELRLNVDRLPPPVRRHREIGAVFWGKNALVSVGEAFGRGSSRSMFVAGLHQ